MMSFQHQDLAEGRWQELTLVEQLANIGSEVGRAIKWRNKNEQGISKRAFYRALELIDLSLVNQRPSALKEICRLRELLVDYFVGDNLYGSTDEQWERYFYGFNFVARK